MKTYFGYSLKGKDLLPLWLLFYLFFILPYASLMYYTMNFKYPGMIEKPSPLLPLGSLGMLIIFFCVGFFFIRKLISGLKYGEKEFQFTGNFGRFLWVIAGFILIPFTLFIYYPFYIRNITRFFINNIRCGEEYLEFNGKVWMLGIILLVTFLPLIVLMVLFGKFLLATATAGFIYRHVMGIVQLVVVVPFIYFLYNWIVDVSYKDYAISWQTEPINAIGKLLLEMGLIMLTFYIYWPMARVKLYKYFLDRTVANNGSFERRFGFDEDHMGDFVFIWKQALLSIVTIGIYAPWAICNVNKRLLERTFVENAPITVNGEEPVTV